MFFYRALALIFFYPENVKILQKFAKYTYTKIAFCKIYLVTYPKTLAEGGGGKDKKLRRDYFHECISFKPRKLTVQAKHKYI